MGGTQRIAHSRHGIAVLRHPRLADDFQQVFPDRIVAESALLHQIFDNGTLSCTDCPCYSDYNHFIINLLKIAQPFFQTVGQICKDNQKIATLRVVPYNAVLRGKLCNPEKSGKI